MGVCGPLRGVWGSPMGLWEALLRHQQLSGLHKVRPPPPKWGGGPPYGVEGPPLWGGWGG